MDVLFVADVNGEDRGIWCTNCHSQLSQEIWRTEDCNDLIRGDCLVNPRAEPTLAAVAAAVGLTEDQAIDYLDEKAASEWDAIKNLPKKLKPEDSRSGYGIPPLLEKTIADLERE